MANEKKCIGFAALSPEIRRELASRGGRTAHERGTANKWSLAQAREAGRKGGFTVSRDPAHMAEIGRIGAEAVAKIRRREREEQAGRPREKGGGARVRVERERSVAMSSEHRSPQQASQVKAQHERDEEAQLR